MGVGLVADGYEAAMNGYIKSFAGVFPDPDSGHSRVIAQNLFKVAVPLDGNIAGSALLNQLVCQDFFRAEAVTAMNDGNVGRDLGEIKRLFNRSASAADNGNRFAAIEKAVAGGAGRDTFPLECFFRREAEISGSCSGRYNQGITAVLPVVAAKEKGLFFRSAVWI